MLFNIVALILIAISLFFAVMWIRSYWRSDDVYRQATPHAWSLTSQNGGLTAGWREYNGLILMQAELHFVSRPAVRVFIGRRRWSLAGFARADFDYTVGKSSPYTLHDDYWTVPYWFLFVVACVVPAIWTVIRYRERRARTRQLNGRCVFCGYDLRGSPVRCPECGKVAASAAN